jgi:hypothetical protein
MDGENREAMPLGREKMIRVLHESIFDSAVFLPLGYL